MPLGTIDRTPPPIFRQGWSALSKLVFFSALALFLMVADTRVTMVAPLRAAIATALLPVQSALLAPVDMVRDGSGYLRGLAQALLGEDAARKQLAGQAERAAQAERLAVENSRLRALLELQPALVVRSVAAEVLYEAADPYSRKLFINRGTTQGVVTGAPVINEAGVLGQVTRAFPRSAELTLLTDRDAAIPVINARTRQRGVAYGGLAKGRAMELRFVEGNADVKIGDLLQTSGIDGVYPAALGVAQVVQVERQAEGGFARVTLAPVAMADGVRHVLVLEPLSVQLPPRPAAEPEASAKPGSRGRKAARGAP
ncbi:MAG: rod shape-determining protein MreC [Burkholderiaceae bacterium]|nr:rod shape-determining protein MreC [Burkholderiaceae bacterium]